MTRASQEFADQSIRPDWSRVRRALVVRLRSIGDTVLMTPCLAALKELRPDIRLSVLMEPMAAPVIEGHPMVDDLIVVEKSLKSRLLLMARLRREGFDVAFNLHGGSTASILARASGARWTAGFKGYRNSRLLNLRAPSPDAILGRAAVHSVEQQLALLKWAGVPWPATRPQLSLAVNEKALGRVQEKLSLIGAAEIRFAIIAPAAAFESKRWRADGFTAVADHLKDKWDLPSVIIAGVGQEHIAREVAREARSAPQVMTGLSLKELIALSSLAQVFIGNDSGPMHIAAAFARPIVVVFGSSNPTVWHPWTEAPYKVVGGGKENAIRRIPVEEVIAAADEVLEMAPGANHRANVGLKSDTAK